MKDRRIIVLLIGLLILAGVVVAVRPRGSSERLTPAPAWRLLTPSKYDGSNMSDPFVSFAPDSRSLLFAVHDVSLNEEVIYHWDIGSRSLHKVTEPGTAPNYLPDGRSFLYLKVAAGGLDSPVGIFKRNLATGKESEVMANVPKTDAFWSQLTSFSYDPASDSVALRYYPFTRRPNFSGDRYSLSGRYLGQVRQKKSLEVVDYSQIGSGPCAMILQAGLEQPQILELAPDGKKSGACLARGPIGAVAYSPDGKMLAYGYGASVDIIYHGGKKVTVGKWDSASDALKHPYVGRLIWSPNGRYLAALYVQPTDRGPKPQIYVLDMAKYR